MGGGVPPWVGSPIYWHWTVVSVQFPRTWAEWLDTVSHARGRDVNGHLVVPIPYLSTEPQCLVDANWDTRPTQGRHDDFVTIRPVRLRTGPLTLLTESPWFNSGSCSWDPTNTKGRSEYTHRSFRDDWYFVRSSSPSPKELWLGLSTPVVSTQTRVDLVVTELFSVPIRVSRGEVGSCWSVGVVWKIREFFVFLRLHIQTRWLRFSTSRGKMSKTMEVLQWLQEIQNQGVDTLPLLLS